MSVAEILNGESVNVEYKARVPEKSLNYMKTVVAFANGFGGRLVFGVADGTREIVGVDEADVFKMMRSPMLFLTAASQQSCRISCCRRSLARQ